MSTLYSGNYVFTHAFTHAFSSKKYINRCSKGSDRFFEVIEDPNFKDEGRNIEKKIEIFLIIYKNIRNIPNMY